MEHRGYDKTDFVITWTEPGDTEESRYEGRYDLGDRDGGLIAHIRNLAQWYLTHDAFGHVKPEPETENAQTRLADWLETFCKDAPEIVTVDEGHKYEITGNRVQFFELMGGRWSPLSDAEIWSEELIEELRNEYRTA